MRSLASTASTVSATPASVSVRRLRAAEAAIGDPEAARNEPEERRLADSRRVERALKPVPLPRDRVEAHFGKRRGALLEDVLQPLVVRRERGVRETAAAAEDQSFRPSPVAA